MDHAHDRWLGDVTALLVNAGCEARRRDELGERIDREFASYAKQGRLRNFIDTCASHSAEIEPLFRAWLTPNVPATGRGRISY